MTEGDRDPSSVPPPSKWAHLGIEADRSAARAAMALASPTQGASTVHMAIPLPFESYPPAQAFGRRRSFTDQLRAARVEARCRGRQLRTLQEKTCRRPRRRVDGNLIVGTVNGNSFAFLREELFHGHVLPQAHYLVVQEHLCRGEACDRAARDAASAGWDAVISPAYV